MGIEKKDIEEVAADLKGAFEDFKKSNDKELEAIKAEKAKLEEKTEKLNEKLSEFDSLKAELEKEIKQSKRPGAPSGGEVDAHKSAYLQFIRKGAEDGLGDLQQKAIQIGVDADGGYAAPEELDKTILELLRDENPMREECGSITISASGYKKLVNIGGASSGWVGETDERGETDTPQLKEIIANMGEIYAKPKSTQTALDDMFFNVESWLAEEVAREFGEQEGNAFLLGNGTNKPKGILTYAMSTANDKSRPFGTLQNFKSGVAGNFDTDNLLDMIYGTKKGYRRGAKFMMNSLTLLKVRKFKDNDGNYIWQPGLQLDQPSVLLGYGIAENEDMPDVAADANALMFGNFKRGYAVVDRMGVRTLRDPYSAKPYVEFYTTKRVGGMLLDSNAIKVLKLSA
ncbi:phage major capsid protein [Acinetobacter colistiniresistens]|uniref:Phage major capsid protein n=1 Tax=Acinetobacter colistiniresistens TaxID=280145 RepID=A0A558EX84_9GAMM|nr:phage major capsid protein [Acinetobacter colistiniresistens]TVT77623.1 phage major capsid protein [Acinetobacter colistiniresistens]